MDFLADNKDFKNILANIGNFFNEKWVRFSLLLILLASVLSAGFFWYKSSVNSKQSVARKLFEESVSAYDRALMSSESKNWIEAEAAFKAGNIQAGNSSLAPYFLIYEAQTLFQQDKFSEGLSLFKKALSKLSKSSPFYNQYQVTYSLALLDSEDSKDNKQGEELLKKLAYSKSNKSRDLALYYLAEYYDSIDNTKESHKVFKDLIKDFLNSKKKVTWKGEISPWAKLAQARMQNL